MERDPVFGCVLDAGHDIGYASGPHDAQWAEAVDTRIAGVHLHEHIVTAHLTVNQASQVFSDSLAFLIHYPSAYIILKMGRVS